MSSTSTSSVWQTVAPYVVPPTAATAAVVPVFRDLVAKSALQRGEPNPKLSFVEGAKQGFKASPTVGGIVGTQMVAQKLVENALFKDEANKTSFPAKLASAAVVGMASSFPLAVFNGQTMGWGFRESARRFTVKQGVAITVQETGCVGGWSTADLLAAKMKKKFGNNKVVEYTAAYVAGAAGGVAGHPANTALTRWQSGMTVNSASQSMLGAAKRAHALGKFTMFYKFVKDTLSPSTGSSK